jgi:hypothetical protein
MRRLRRFLRYRLRNLLRSLLHAIEDRIIGDPGDIETVSLRYQGRGRIVRVTYGITGHRRRGQSQADELREMAACATEIAVEELPE